MEEFFYNDRKIGLPPVNGGSRVELDLSRITQTDPVKLKGHIVGIVVIHAIDRDFGNLGPIRKIQRQLEGKSTPIDIFAPDCERTTAWETVTGNFHDVIYDSNSIYPLWLVQKRGGWIGGW